jgi:DNA-binding response OmpR family regulator
MAPRKPHIVIVEDDPDTLLMLRVNLEAVGFQTSLAADGGTAIRRVLAEKPDVVLLDLMLPVLDGWAVLAELGSRGAPPVVVCSARATPRDRRRAHDMGATAFVAKPFNVDDLVDALRTVLTTDPEAERELSLEGLIGRPAPRIEPA